MMNSMFRLKPAPVFIFILSLVALTWWAGDRIIEKEIKRNLAEQLETTLNSAVQGLRVWYKEKSATSQVWAAQLDVRTNILSLLGKAGGLTPDQLLKTEELAQLRVLLEPVCGQYGFIGFVVTDLSGRQVAALLDDAIGKKSAFDPARIEKTTLSQPLHDEALLSDDPGSVKSKKTSMFISTPVRDSRGQTVAVLSFSMRPESDFTRILEVARSGQTGETYAFNINAEMISESRFPEQLKKISILIDSSRETSILNVKLVDPGGNMLTGFRPRTQNQTLTYMAERAVSGLPGVNVAGYRDYRGVPVVGAWVWLSEFGFGVASEIDWDEAYAPLHSLRKFFIFLFVSLTAIFFGVLLLGQRQLRGSERHLRVSESEILREKKFSERLVDGNMDGIYAFDRNYRYTAWNPSMERMTGVKKIDAINKIYFESSTFLNDNEEERNMKKALKGQNVFVRDRPFKKNIASGDGFYEGRYSPLRDENGDIIGGVAIIRDITDRKKRNWS